MKLNMALQNFTFQPSRTLQRLKSIGNFGIAVVLTTLLLVGSLIFHGVRNPDLVEGESAAPVGSSLKLDVRQVPDGILVAGQEVMFNFSATYVLNADRGKVRLIMQTSSDECNWREMTSEIIRGSGFLFTNVGLGWEKLPPTSKIRFVALLAAENQTETSTKAVFELSVSTPEGRTVSTSKTLGCRS